MKINLEQNNNDFETTVNTFVNNIFVDINEEKLNSSWDELLIHAGTFAPEERLKNEEIEFIKSYAEGIKQYAKKLIPEAIKGWDKSDALSNHLKKPETLEEVREDLFHTMILNYRDIKLQEKNHPDLYEDSKMKKEEGLSMDYYHWAADLMSMIRRNFEKSIEN